MERRVNALAAIAELQRRGLDVYVRPNGEVWIRAHVVGRSITAADVAFAKANSAAISAFGTEHIQTKGTHVDARR